MLNKRLEELRKKMKMTKKEVAELLKIDQSTYGKYELGKRQPDSEMLKKLAEIFDCTTDYLLGLSNIRNPADEIANAVKDDPELADFWNLLRQREDLKLLFKQTKKLEPSEIQQIIRIIKAIEDDEANE